MINTEASIEMFQQDVDTTYHAIANEYGADTANAALAEYNDMRIAKVVSYFEQHQEAEQDAQDMAEYEAELARITSEHPEIDPEAMHEWVAWAEGDLDAATQGYLETLAEGEQAAEINEAVYRYDRAEARFADHRTSAISTGSRSLDNAIDNIFRAPPVG